MASAGLAAWLVACAAPSVTPSPRTATARFSARMSNVGQGAVFPGGRNATPACLAEAHFDGTARPTADGVDLLIDNASVAVDRKNDKTLDPLLLTIKVADGRHLFGYDNDLSYILSPTVDSATAQLTTWQSTDTLRMLLPWPAGASPRWLRFSLGYYAVSHTGAISTCDGELRTDTLRFRSHDTSPR